MTHIGDVHSPDLVGMDHRLVPEQVRIDLVLRVTSTGVWLAVQRTHPYALQQRANMPTAYALALAIEQAAQHARARKRVGGMQGIDSMHQLHLRLAGRLALIVQRASADTHKLGLPSQ